MQVWIEDRREQALEDTSVFTSGDPQRAQDYYLGFQYRRVAGTDAKFAAEWGLEAPALRPPERRAPRAAGGRRVILGGHSAGASSAVAYAAWDFGGRPGYRDIDGLVLIDGGLLGSFRPAGLARAKRILPKLRRGKVFNDVLGLGIPEINGIFAEVGALSGRTGGPDEPSVLQQYPGAPRVGEAAGARDERGALRLRVRRDHVASASSTTSTSTRAAWRQAATRAAGATAS